MPEHDTPHSSDLPFARSEGVTPSERYLKRLCEHSFLSVWSYPGVYRNEGRSHGKGHGKELCDLLVVFQRHIIIFSDKHCHFGNSGDLQLDWARWYKKTVFKSALQVFGAERWIREFPQGIFLDRPCTIPFPIDLPDSTDAIFHRIVVAHDGSRRCREVLGGSGSLMVHNDVVGDRHLTVPFTIGRIDSSKGYIHVFDDTTLDVVLKTLDTIRDFTDYLTKKEKFLTGDRLIMANGEEELLAHYLANLNKMGEHDFVIDGDFDVLHFGDGLWEKFVTSPERLAQIEHNRISYSWDKLIEKFAFHAMTGTDYYKSDRTLRDQEVIFRLLAAEPRVRRRALAKSLRDVLDRSAHSSSPWDARVVPPSRTGDPYYVFLFVKRPPEVSDEQYREMRVSLLSAYCHIVKLKNREAKDIIGIASESGLEVRRSEDLIYIDGSKWTPEAEAQAQKAQKELGLLRNVKGGANREYEYPVDHTGKPRAGIPSRNSACPCGSGKRFKRCHGKASSQRTPRK